jgi:hypothetical protein
VDGDADSADYGTARRKDAMRKILAALGGLILLLAVGTSSSAQAAISPAAGTFACSTTLLVDFHTGDHDWVHGGYLTFTNNLSNATYLCFRNLGGGEFELLDSTTGGCLSINSTTSKIQEQSAAGCNLNGGHGYVYDRWYWLSQDTSSGTFQYANMYYTNGVPDNNPNVGCMYGDTTPAEYVVPCNTSPGADKAEWFQ